MYSSEQYQLKGDVSVNRLGRQPDPARSAFSSGPLTGGKNAPGIVGQYQFFVDFVIGFLSIVLIDLVLAGENAVVIAMAVRSLAPKQRKRGIMIGAGGAVCPESWLTFVAAQLLTISMVKFLGGALITWIAVQLFVEGAPEDKFQRQAKTLGQAVVTVMIADLVMSVDNILAVAGASKGNVFLSSSVWALHPLRGLHRQSAIDTYGQVPIIVYLGALVSAGWPAR